MCKRDCKYWNLEKHFGFSHVARTPLSTTVKDVKTDFLVMVTLHLYLWIAVWFEGTCAEITWEELLRWLEVTWGDLRWLRCLRWVRWLRVKLQAILFLAFTIIWNMHVQGYMILGVASVSMCNMWKHVCSYWNWEMHLGYQHEAHSVGQYFSMCSMCKRDCSYWNLEEYLGRSHVARSPFSTNMKNVKTDFLR